MTTPFSLSPSATSSGRKNALQDRAGPAKREASSQQAVTQEEHGMYFPSRTGMVDMRKGDHRRGRLTPFPGTTQGIDGFHQEVEYLLRVHFGHLL